MPTLYDSYNLANSSGIPRYQGSAVPELEQVASTMQGRYDTAQNSMDATDQAMKSAIAAPVDQPLLNNLITEKKQKLAAFSQRGDLENLWRDTMMEAKDFGNRYAPIAANAQKMQGWQAEITKRQQEGKINSQTAEAAQAHAMDNYSGLKYDGTTGKYSNAFTGTDVMNDVDIPKKINTWIADAHPEIRGGEVKKDNGEWVITNGTETKKLPLKEVMRIVNSGVDMDPEVQPWIQQEQALAPYKIGVTKKVPDSAILGAYANNPDMLNVLHQGMQKGLSAAQVAQQVISANRGKQILGDIQDYATKGVVDEKKVKYEEEMGELQKHRLMKQADQDLMIPQTIVAQTGGIDVKSEGDFRDAMSKGQGDLKTMQDALDNFSHAPNRQIDPATGKVYEMVNGQKEDVTPQYNNMKAQVDQKQKDLTDLENIRKAAALSAGYDPTKTSPAIRKAADDAAQAAYNQALNVTAPTGKSIDQGVMYHSSSPEDVANAQKAAQSARDEYVRTQSPRYAEYEQELMKRLKPLDESSKVWGMPGDKLKTEIGQMVTDMSSKLKLKGAMLGFNIAAGPDAGQQVTASDYNDLEGKIEPVGIGHSSKDGSTQIIFRAKEDIQGKKVKGENMLLSMPDAGWVDDYVKKRMLPKDQHYFYMDQALKSGLNNPTASMEYPIRDKDGKQVQTVKVVRNKASNSGANPFIVKVQGPNGWVQIPKDSYEGVTDIIDQVQEHYLPTPPAKQP